MRDRVSLSARVFVLALGVVAILVGGGGASYAQQAAATQPAPLAGAFSSANPPVKLTYLGMLPNKFGKKDPNFRIKILADKLEQVDIQIVCYDAGGKKLDDVSLVAWQNIVLSRKQPIEKGKTYEWNSFESKEAVRCDTELKHVFFEDHSMWKP